MKYQFICFLCLILSLGTSCNRLDKEDDPRKEDSIGGYTFVKPDNFPEPYYTFENNPVTEEGFKLGKKLFFDPLLSRDGSISCGSCHLQQRYFSDASHHPTSVGVEDRLGTRNTPALTNLAFMKEFFWDGGVTHLDFVPINAITASFEMDETMQNVVLKLNKNSEYRELFKSTFDVDSINSAYMLHALSQFMVMMVSSNSKYDKYVRDEGESLNIEELEGMHLFQEKCSTCHNGELFTDLSYRNNGLSAQSSDAGRKGITELDSDDGKFRVPSLRNVGATSPYMHDAKYLTLEQVLDHYDSEVKVSATLDTELKNNGVVGIPMTETEKGKIISFLNTLTDYEFVTDSRFFQ